MRREDYVGEWLPEPVLDAEALSPGLDAYLSMAFLLALERLTPLERAAFLLHDIFGAPSPRCRPRWTSRRRPAVSWPPGPTNTSRPDGRAIPPPPRRKSA